MISNSLNINDATKFIKNELKILYTSSEIQQLIYIIFDHLLNFSKTDVHTKTDIILSKSNTNQLYYIIFLLKKEMPVEYIVGKTYFYNLIFNVSSDVLIPRPETEELADWIIKENKLNNLNILDIGTGSGCIAVSLAKYINDSHVDAMDISKNAISIARLNAKRNDVKINFFINDILCLKNNSKKYKYNIIVSNPPYVMEQEKDVMKLNVLNFEPHEALFVPDDDPLIYYRSIINFAINNLDDNGIIYFEINERFSVEITNLLIQMGFLNVIIRKDINNKFRFVKAMRN